MLSANRFLVQNSLSSDLWIWKEKVTGKPKITCWNRKPLSHVDMLILKVIVALCNHLWIKCIVSRSWPCLIFHLSYEIWWNLLLSWALKFSCCKENSCRTVTLVGLGQAGNWNWPRSVSLVVLLPCGPTLEQSGPHFALWISTLPTCWRNGALCPHINLLLYERCGY